MGGQACILHGGQEFSRDLDVAIGTDARNLGALHDALERLEAVVIAVPPFKPEYLDRGHSVHFRCQLPEVGGVRLDVMSRHRTLEPFPRLWNRRTAFHVGDDLVLPALSVDDLVRSKKTERLKDWGTIEELVNAHYSRNILRDDPVDRTFWFREMRNPSALVEVAEAHPREGEATLAERPLVRFALSGDEEKLRVALREEMQAEMEAHIRYWAPLRSELEELRHEIVRGERPRP